MTTVIDYSAYGFLALIVTAFLLLAWRDLALLFRRPKGMGTGFSRVWAVGRTSLAEAWAAKAWMVVPIWLAVCFIINLTVHTHSEDVRERIGLYMMVLLRGQEYLLLVLVGVLACFSLPRERERRTIVTTGSKPISRLELYLGKVAGFASMAAVLILAMGLVSYGYLFIADLRGRSESRTKYERAKEDFDKGIPGAVPPLEGVKLDAERGVLQADNFITSSGGVQVAGRVDYRDNTILQYLKGGSSERMVMRFPRLVWDAQQESPGFWVRFAVSPVLPNIPLPPEISLQVQISAERNPSAAKDHQILLRPSREVPGIYETVWRPDPTGVMSDDRDYGPVHLEVTCMTKNYFLLMWDGGPNNQYNFMALDSADAPGNLVYPLEKPRILGFEKYDLQQVEGPPASVPLRSIESMTPEDLQVYSALLEAARWQFRARDISGKRVPRNSDGTFTLSLYLDVDKVDNVRWPTYALVTAYNPSTQQSAVLRPVVVAEKRLTEVTLPASLLTSDDDLCIDVRCLTPGHWLGAAVVSARLPLKDSLFIWNLAKAEMVIFAEIALLVVIAVMASVRLGGAVALLLAAFCYFFSISLPFVQRVSESGVIDLFSAAEQKDLNAYWGFRASAVVYGVLMKGTYFIVKLMPDFRIFDPMSYIVHWRNMPMADLGFTLFWTVLYAVPMLALAYLLVRKQELA